MTSLDEMRQIAARIRFDVVRMSHETGAAHLGSSLSCADILTAAYWGVLAIDPARPDDPDRDRFILSKGHAATTLFSALAHRGYFGLEVLDTYARPGSALQEHPGVGCAPGVEAATGSLGHGLGMGLGMALAGRLQGRRHRVIVVMSDGEMNEGTTWEAAMFAPAHRLDNVAIVIDFNKWQATGRSCEVMALEPLRAKWEAFGWRAVEVDGHDIQALVDILGTVPDGSGKPLAVVAHTVKGKGISFMEDDNNWHYRIPTDDEVEACRIELGLP